MFKSLGNYILLCLLYLFHLYLSEWIIHKLNWSSSQVKGLLHPKILFTYPHVVPTPWKLCSSSGTQFKIFLIKTRRLVTVPLTAKQLTHLEKYERHRQNSPSATSGSIWMLWSDENTFCIQNQTDKSNWSISQVQLTDSLKNHLNIGLVVTFDSQKCWNG